MATAAAVALQQTSAAFVIPANTLLGVIARTLTGAFASGNGDKQQESRHAQQSA